MAWLITCLSETCGKQTWAADIVDLIKNRLSPEGWIRCQCGQPGYVAKKFALQEKGETWEPYLRGVVPLGEAGEVYQPFVFLVSYTPGGPIEDAWFSYYKDMRKSGGRLKLGYGPGGPPVLSWDDILSLVRHAIKNGLVREQQVYEAIQRKV